MADRLNIRSVDVDASTTDNNSTPPKAEVELPDVDAEVVDRFDPKRLRLSQDFAAQLGVRKKLITVPVKKPPKEWWVQVHPDDDYHIETAVLELKEEREVYLVDPSLWEELSTESTFSPRAIYTARRSVPLADQDARPRRQAGRMESVGVRGSRDSPRPLGSRPGEHEPRRLRGVGGLGQTSRPAMARAGVPGLAPHCVQGSLYRRPTASCLDAAAG